MKAENTVAPEKFKIENIINGRCDVILNTNIEVIEDDEKNKKYLYDTYRINIDYEEDMKEKLEDEEYYNSLLELAKKEYEQKLANEVRKIRDELLKETDKFLLDDFPILPEVKEKYKSYRNALREIPEQSGFPHTVLWPSLEE